MVRILWLVSSALILSVDITAATIVWKPCPVYTPQMLPVTARSCNIVPLLKRLRTKAFCATVEVPLTYSNVSSEAIPYFVKRVQAPSPKGPIGEVWLLNGGPGESGAVLECMLADLIKVTGGMLDIVIPDHRGVGRSSALNCDEPTFAMTAACLNKTVAKYGADYIRAFTTTNAAKDIHFIIQSEESERRRRGPGFKRMVYGVSYGSYWAQRYLKLYPDDFDVVVLDGVMSMDTSRFGYYSYGVQSAGEVVMAMCGRDAVCHENLGESPIYNIHMVYELMRAGHLECSAKLGNDAFLQPRVLKSFVSRMLMSWEKRPLIGPIFKRLLRCNEADVKELKTMFHIHLNAQVSRSVSPWMFDIQMPVFPEVPMNVIIANRSAQLSDEDMRKSSKTPEPTLPELLNNPILYFNIVMSELFDYKHGPASSAGGLPLTSESLITTEEELLDFVYGSVGNLITLLNQSAWPVYTTDPKLEDQYPETDARMLIMSGTTDAQTPLNWMLRAGQIYSKKNQHQVPIPGAVHCSAFKNKSPVRTSGGLDCGMQILGSFLNSVGASVNTSCLEDLLPIDFAGARAETRVLSTQTFGTPELWGTATPPVVGHAVLV